MSALKKLQDKINEEKARANDSQNPANDDWRILDDKGQSVHTKIRREEHIRKVKAS